MLIPVFLIPAFPIPAFLIPAFLIPAFLPPTASWSILECNLYNYKFEILLRQSRFTKKNSKTVRSDILMVGQLVVINALFMSYARATSLTAPLKLYSDKQN